MLPFRCKNIAFYKSLDYPVSVISISYPGSKIFFKASCPYFPNICYCGETSEEDALHTFKHMMFEHIENLISSGDLVPLPDRYGLFGLEFLSQLRDKYVPDGFFEPTISEHTEWQSRLEQAYSDGNLADLVIALDKACAQNEISKNAVTTIVVNLGILEDVSVR